MNAPGITGAAPAGPNRPQQPSLLPVVPPGPASSSSGQTLSAASGPASVPELGSAGPSGQASGSGPSSSHIPSESLPIEAGHSQTATSPASTSATGSYMQRSRRRWTAEEDAKLISAVKAYGSARGPGSAWSLISQGIPGRTNKFTTVINSRACDLRIDASCHAASVVAYPGNVLRRYMSGNAGGNAGGVILCSLSEGTIPRVLMRGSHCRLASMLYLLSWQGPCIDPYTFSTLSPQDSSVDRQDCRKRWFHSLDPSVRKGKWSPNEDDALRKLYSELGPQWKEIALRIPGRKDDQVSKRWRDVLAPELTSKKPWSGKEDALLLELLEKLGPRWTAIADKLPGRSPIACRNRSRKFRKQRPEPSQRHGCRISVIKKRTNPAVADDTPSSTGASGSGSGTASARSGSGSGVASAGPSTVPLPSMMTERSMQEDGEPDWRLPADLNPSISVSSFNFDLDQNRLVGPSPHDQPGAPGPGGPGSQGPPGSVPGQAPPAPPSAASGPQSTGGSMMGDSVMGIAASPAVNTSGLPMSHQSVSPTTHMDQLPPQMEGWMPPTPMQMGMPLFDRAVDDMWGLFVALDRGDPAVLVDSNLLRQLVAGAASGIGHPPMPGRT
ncbi:hypothetical protein A1Q1_07804 [Trichosporon asahii var. asahii CBS 2479]|uniref:Uncharacterized protein n=1 Tax=Trichosporon asahii var. asahii (strain ATCC 90039 / CBS 2479 / JCM 2466 / KCTC 7840 / NBRC 103889/ NCYC 2677 / UAMH 7654) TaxID=1186058 RepID=J4UHH9_TRIAS|nr:hypothetical protein A1Q1_07804 [Trichosporon asahii var. asahii CBS 2479]EJT51010.1 hypothetical protein A1Q1_07804 [Trichosporon asahii var. asahii CBS 2479]